MNHNPYKRKKDPQAIQQNILDTAIKMVAEKGVTAVSLQSVADVVGISKGGLLHHYASKQKLTEAMIVYILQQIDSKIDELIEADQTAYGCFTRAYIRLNLNAKDPILKLWNAFSMTMLTDKSYNSHWNNWFAQRLQKHHQTDHALALHLLRYAADGLWLSNMIEDQNVSEMTDYLIEQSYNA